MLNSKKSHSSKHFDFQPGVASCSAAAIVEHKGHRLLQQKKLRQKLGDVSSMWLFRHKDELPKPILIAGRRFWLEEEVDVYIGSLSSGRKIEETDRRGDDS